MLHCEAGNALFIKVAEVGENKRKGGFPQPFSNDFIGCLGGLTTFRLAKDSVSSQDDPVLDCGKFIILRESRCLTEKAVYHAISVHVVLGWEVLMELKRCRNDVNVVRVKKRNKGNLAYTEPGVGILQIVLKRCWPHELAYEGLFLG